MKIMLSSGTWIGVQAIKLFHEREVSEIEALRAKAAKVLGGNGTFFGVGGAPSWTLAAEMGALSLVGGLLANAAQKQAVAFLTEAQNRYSSLLSHGGKFIEISAIKKIELPVPAAWFATDGAKGYRHSGDDFVWVKSEPGIFAVKWSEVALVQPVETPQAAIEDRVGFPAGRPNLPPPGI